MSDYGRTDNNAPIIDKNYCDDMNIRSDWFKYDKNLAELFMGIVEESTDKNGCWCLNDASSLGYVVYAITSYFLFGTIPPELEKALNSKDKKLHKLAYIHATQAIEVSRVRMAELRLQGRKGGLSRGKKRESSIS